MTYKEHIYEVCKNTDLDDKDDVIETISWLATELIRANKINLDYDEKLKEVMTAKDYLAFVEEKAKELFKEEIEEMAESEFKTFCIDYFDEITGGNNA